MKKVPNFRKSPSLNTRLDKTELSYNPLSIPGDKLEKPARFSVRPLLPCLSVRASAPASDRKLQLEARSPRPNAATPLSSLFRVYDLKIDVQGDTDTRPKPRDDCRGTLKSMTCEEKLSLHPPQIVIWLRPAVPREAVSRVATRTIVCRVCVCQTVSVCVETLIDLDSD